MPLVVPPVDELNAFVFLAKPEDDAPEFLLAYGSQ